MQTDSFKDITEPADLVLVGYVSGAYGLGGWVRIKPYASGGNALLAAKTWWIDKPIRRDIDVMKAKMHSGDVVAQWMGVADREAAQALRGAEVSISRAHFPPLENEEFYWVDLLGLMVENLDGAVLGQVMDIMDNGAHPILKIALPNAAVEQKSEPKELLIPFVGHFVKTVDQPAGKITVDWGLDF